MGRKRAITSPQTPETHHNAEAQMVSEYERSREERIKENLQRLQNLGILNLSLQVKALKPTSKSTRKTHYSASPLPPPGPTRRSSRLQSAAPVSYCEVKVPKDKSLDFGYNLLRLEGSRPEVYTEEHEKLLGSTEKTWTLFVDGVGKDGKRIYDQFNGKTCHQCRQKTLGHRTHCSKCEIVQGQFCGDCLYMRYGEHILEAKQNPNWICPACRGICNCSLCRNAKGWPPTGSLYRKISALGYKSVAHYLIQTRRENTESDTKTKVPLSAKRSLPFLETETASTDMETSKSNCPLELVDYNSEEAKYLQSSNEDIREKAQDSVDALPNSKLVSGNIVEIVVKPEIALEAPEELQGFPEPEITQTIGTKQEVRIGTEKEIELSNCDVMNKVIEMAALSKSEIREISCCPTSVVPPVLDKDKLQKPVASDEKNVHSDDPAADVVKLLHEPVSSNEKNVHSEKPVAEGVGKLRLSQKDNSEEEDEEEVVKGSIVGHTKPLNGVSSLDLVSCNDEAKDVNEVKRNEIEKTPISKRKHGRAIELVVDSIAGRLRQRRPRIN